MAELTTYSISLPVHLADKREGSLVQGKSSMLGTCFPLGGRYMLTAGHVVTELEKARSDLRGHPAVGIFHPTTCTQTGIRIAEMEVLAGDIGLLQAEFIEPSQESWLFPLHWSVGQMTLGSLIRAPGYAYADHSVGSDRFIVQRSFQGSIVSEIGTYLPAGMNSNPFGVYETSFAAPRGHSGAPLLREDGRVVGVVIGNSKSKMLVLDAEETSTDGKTTTLIEQYESLALGVSVQAGFVLGLHSRLLRCSINDYLSRNGLVHVAG